MDGAAFDFLQVDAVAGEGFDGGEELLLIAPYIHGIRTHGTGCTYSAAITGYLARGFSLAAAVKRAKQFITQVIARVGSP